MLQQTQVNTVIPYYNRFMESFPTIQDLANADLETVLKHWEGLGYYSRARNLHKGAKYITDELNSIPPENYDETIKIPGFGPYTSSAVLSFAKNKDLAVVDGNVIRVITRLFSISDDMRVEKNKKIIQEIVNNLLPIGYSQLFNEAMMEHGAVTCSPKKPKCTICSIQKNCNAYSSNTVEHLPYKSKKEKIPTRVRTAYILIDSCKQLLITKRSNDEMLGGLWQFPSHYLDEKPSKFIFNAFKPDYKLDKIKHSYSHFKLELHGLVYNIDQTFELNTNEKLVDLDQLEKLPFDNATRKLIRSLESYLRIT